MTQEILLVIHNYLIKHNKTLSIAESCTGGTLSALITSIAGCSQYFLGSIISYSNQLKKELLKVTAEDLEQFGAVSEGVAEQMSRGVCLLTGSNYGISVTGVAGPTGGSELKPVGTVWVSIFDGEKAINKKYHFSGNRAEIIQQTNEKVLSDFCYILCS